MSYNERKIKIKSFERKFNPQVTGCYCAFNDKHFIDYKEECYIHPQLRITICKKCRYQDTEQTSKFHNVERSYGGHTYHSTLEAEFAKQLDLKIRTGLIKEWQRQVKIEINVKMIPTFDNNRWGALLKEFEQKYIKPRYVDDLDIGDFWRWMNKNFIPRNDSPIPVLTTEPVADLKAQGIEAYHITNYYMDFVVTNNDGSKTFYETKGMELSVWKLKFRLTEMIFRNKIQLEVIKKQSYKPNKRKKL